MIDTDDKLADFLPQLRATQWIALDTEADSLHAYPEKLCLLQLSLADTDELLDPLSRMNLAPALAELQRHELIMHGADYDLRLLRRHCDFVPTAIFDTMIASRLLGDRHFGLDSLVLKYLEVPLEKGPQKANWARRPLTPRMEAYARNDTRHLKALADILSGHLREKGRLAWHQETCAQLVGECATVRPVDPDLQWRVKGSSKLSPAALTVLRELWYWRETEATAANKPPFFILTPEQMVELASAAAAGRPLPPLVPRHYSHRRRESVLQVLKRGLKAGPPPAPLSRQRHRRPTEAEKRRRHNLERRRNQHAAELAIDPALIASRATLALLAQDWGKHQGQLLNWQRQLLEN